MPGAGEGWYRGKWDPAPVYAEILAALLARGESALAGQILERAAADAAGQRIYERADRDAAVSDLAEALVEAGLRDQLPRLAALVPPDQSGAAQSWTVLSLLDAGQIDGAAAAARSITDLERRPEVLIELCERLCAAGRRVEACRYRAQLNAAGRGGYFPIAGVLSRLGFDEDAAAIVEGHEARWCRANALAGIARARGISGDATGFFDFARHTLSEMRSDPNRAFGCWQIIDRLVEGLILLTDGRGACDWAKSSLDQKEWSDFRYSLIWHLDLAGRLGEARVAVEEASVLGDEAAARLQLGQAQARLRESTAAKHVVQHAQAGRFDGALAALLPIGEGHTWAAAYLEIASLAHRANRAELASRSLALALAALRRADGEAALLNSGKAIGRTIRMLEDEASITALARQALSQAARARSPFAAGALLIAAGEAARPDP